MSLGWKNTHITLTNAVVQSYDAADQRSQCFHPFLHKREFFVHHVVISPPYFRYYLSYDQIIGMDLIESE